MNLADVLRGLWRRWYVVVPGVILAVAAGIGAWQLVPPSYERTGTQLLLPGSASIPQSGNPYLYLGGLSQASDVLVTAMSSESGIDALLKGHPGAKVVIARAPSTPGPQILITVTARTDSESGVILNAAIARTVIQLDNLQNIDGITSGNRIAITSITVDDHSTLIQKNRILGVIGASVAVLLVTLLTAALIDGLSTRKRRRASLGAEAQDIDVEAPSLEDDTRVRPRDTNGALDDRITSREQSDALSASSLDEIGHQDVGQESADTSASSRLTP